MNGHNNIYVVTFGWYRTDYVTMNYWNDPQFDYLKDARDYVKGYSNAHITKLHFAADSGDLMWSEEIQ